MKNKNEQIKKESKHLRGTLQQSLVNPVTGAIVEDDQFLIKFHGIYQQDDRDIRERRAEKKLEPLYSFMLRLRIPAGKITAKQWLGIDEIANQNSTGIIKITTRETVQLHGVIKSKLKPTLAWFKKFDLDSIATCGDVNRNVMATVAPAKNLAYDQVLEYARKISERLLPKTKAYHEIWLDGEKISPEDAKKEDEADELYGELYLPRKFKIAIAIPPDNDVDAFANDIGLIAIIENGELIGFNVAIGGGLGTTHGNPQTYPRIASMVGFVPHEKMLDAVYQILTVQRDYGNREDRKLSRLKYTVDKYGVDWFREELEKRQGFKFEKPREFKFEMRNDYYGWSQDYQGNWHFLHFVENGRILDTPSPLSRGEVTRSERSEELRDEGGAYPKLKTAILEIAKANLANFRFTANQNIMFSDILPADKSKVEAIFTKHNIHNNVSEIRKSAMACVAFNTCPLALAEGQRYMPSLITKIEEILAKHKLEKEPISIRMTGCPNGCARPYMSEIGLVGKSYGKYNLYLGGSALGERLNKLYKEELDETEILKELDHFLGLYSANKNPKENFGDFMDRYLIQKTVVI